MHNMWVPIVARERGKEEGNHGADGLVQGLAAVLFTGIFVHGEVVVNVSVVALGQ